MIEGLSHITFIVRDLDRMATIITDGLGGTEVYSSEDKTFSVARERFFIVGDVWIAAMQGEALPDRSYNHVAFKVSEADLDSLAAKLLALGVEVKPSRPRVEGEGRSVYFYDDDNHLFELHTGTLPDRLKRYAQP